MKKLNNFLNILIGAFVGVWIGHAFFVWWDYKTHPELYAVRSAPWYTSIQLWGAVALVAILLAVILKIIIRRFSK